jgi:diguanylate cyclase (GGDEF)-like protein
MVFRSFYDALGTAAGRARDAIHLSKQYLTTRVNYSAYTRAMLKISLKNPRLSLGQVLTIPYVVLVVALAVVTVGLSYREGLRIVDSMASSLVIETAKRIDLTVEKHIMGSSAVLEAAFPDGLSVSSDIAQEIDSLRNRFWIATSLHTDPNNYVYFGNKGGQVLGLYRRAGDEAELRMKLRADQNREFFRFNGINGKPVFVSRETKLFDPRQRPWYLAAQSQTTQTWTSVYIDFSSGDLVATRARRVLGEDQQFEGVVATDVSLKKLNSFISNLKVSPNGIALILEPNGDLIASSVSPNIALNPDGSRNRINAKSSDNTQVAALYSHIQTQLPRLDSKSGPQTITYKGSDGETLYASINRLKDKSGLSWISAVVIPQSDFMAGMAENLVKTGLLAGFAALVTILLGLRVLGWVTKDLRHLAEHAQKIGQGQLDSPIHIAREDEIGRLASSFTMMQTRLLTDKLTGLANREALVLGTQKRCRQAFDSQGANERTDHFALLFIDLNQFKVINDVMGHQVGDEALIEIGQRLLKQSAEKDLVARLSGDEFVMLINDVNGNIPLASLRLELQIALSRPLQCLKDSALEDQSFGGAIGHAIFPEDGLNATALLKKADRRMYKQKFSRRSSDRAGMPETEKDSRSSIS